MKKVYRVLKKFHSFLQFIEIVITNLDCNFCKFIECYWPLAPRNKNRKNFLLTPYLSRYNKYGWWGELWEPTVRGRCRERSESIYRSVQNVNLFLIYSNFPFWVPPLLDSLPYWGFSLRSFFENLHLWPAPLTVTEYNTRPLGMPPILPIPIYLPT